LVAERAGRGEQDAGVGVGQLASRLEADPGDRAVLEAAVAASLEAVPEWREAGPQLTGWSARAAREARASEAAAAIERLVVQGELAGDGPGRVRLPGFGAATWRAFAVLREDPDPERRRWAAAVAAGPTADLGAAAPAFLPRGRPDPRLIRAAALIHGMEAARQDARHALLLAGARLGEALERGHADSAAELRASCDAAAARLAELDAAIGRAWAAGEALARLTSG
jgi:hypothetical protein